MQSSLQQVTQHNKKSAQTPESRPHPKPEKHIPSPATNRKPSVIPTQEKTAAPPPPPPMPEVYDPTITHLQKGRPQNPILGMKEMLEGLGKNKDQPLKAVHNYLLRAQEERERERDAQKTARMLSADTPNDIIIVEKKQGNKI